MHWLRLLQEVPKYTITTLPLGRVTRRTSLDEFISPKRKSSSGTRFFAILRRFGEESNPLTLAPRFASIALASPEPQPMSSSFVPLPTEAASRIT
jgi:hypothetical protein